MAYILIIFCQHDNVVLNKDVQRHEDCQSYWKVETSFTESTLDQHWTNISVFAENSCVYSAVPANTRRLTNVDSILAHRLRRWPNIKPTLVHHLVFAGVGLYDGQVVEENNWIIDFAPSHRRSLCYDYVVTGWSQFLKTWDAGLMLIKF